MIQGDFTGPVCRPGKLDTFIVRKSILRALEKQLPLFRGTLLDVGRGQKPYRTLVTSRPGRVTEYIGLDLVDNPIHDNRPDITWRDGAIPLPRDRVDCAIARDFIFDQKR